MPLPLAASAAILALSSFLMLRDRTLRASLAVQALCWAFAGFLRCVPLVVAPLDPYLCAVAALVAQLVVIVLFVAAGERVRWSPGRAALFAGIVYCLLVPAMTRFPIDGDEPFYLLVAESVAHDHDFDLRNQYAHLDRSAAGRTDLKPQMGDPSGPHGERYSRHEPFFPILLIPGLLFGGLDGAVVIVVLFGALLVRSTLRLIEEEGVTDAAARIVFPFFAFGPPVIFYVARLWPEIPAAFAFVEAVRGLRHSRAARWVPALCGLVLLKLRFVLIAGGLMIRAIWTWRDSLRNIPRRTLVVVALLLLAMPLFIAWIVSGSATSVHVWGELDPGTARHGVVGFFGLLLDGAAGIAFQAPFYLVGVFALSRWRSMPEGFRLGMSAGLIYIIYLVPRPEWHGGWAPPLRYIVVFMPILALGAATLIERSRMILAPLAAATIALVIHGSAYPYRLFHIASGENEMGEYLSRFWHSDFSRLFPSFVRPNVAAAVSATLLVALFLLRPRLSWSLAAAVSPLILALMFAAGRVPGNHIELEDSYVQHEGGGLFPAEYTVARFLYRGGWTLRPGDSVSFPARSGRSSLHYSSPGGSTIAVGGEVYALPSTGPDYATVGVVVPRQGRTVIRCLDGSANLDRIEHE